MYEKKYGKKFKELTDEFLEKRNLFNIRLVDLRRELKKNEKSCDLLNDHRISYLYDNPSLNIKIRYNEHAFTLNSSFLSTNEKDRLSISTFCKLSDYYDLSILLRHEDSFELKLEEKKTNKDNKDQINDLLLASHYYSN